MSGDFGTPVEPEAGRPGPARIGPEPAVGGTPAPPTYVPGTPPLPQPPGSGPAPGYSAPFPGYPGPPVPPYPGPQGVPGVVPRQRGRRLWVIGLVAALVVVVLVGVAGVVGVSAVVLSQARKSHPSTVAPGPNPSPAAAPTPSPSAANITFTAPDHIGSLNKKADQSTADKVLTTLSNSGLEHPFAAVYEDTAARGRTAIVWGGVGEIYALGDPHRMLNAFFSGFGKTLGGHATMGPATDTDPGTVGGVAQCAKVEGLGITQSVCAWNGNGALLGVLYNGLSPERAAQQLPAILAAVVVKN